MTSQVTSPSSAALTIDKVGRRYYLRALPYGLKDLAKGKGAKWDSEARCWWTGKAEVAEAIRAATAAAGPVPLSGRPTMLSSGVWGARVFGACAAGDAIAVESKGGKKWTTTVVRVVRVDGDSTIVETPPRVASASASSSQKTRRSRPARTGCYCGSVEGVSRTSDCWTCKHDDE